MQIMGLVIFTVFLVLKIIANIKKPSSVYKNNKAQQNPMEGKKVQFIENENEKENADGVRGHLEPIGDAADHMKFYDRFIKRVIDVVLSFCALIVLSPVFLILALWIINYNP